MYYKPSMKTSVVLQRKRGQSPKRAGEYDPIMSLRMPIELRSKVKDWAMGQEEKLSISKAICRLVERGLAGESGTAKPRRPAKAPSRGKK
jgi:hypothetical protein